MSAFKNEEEFLKNYDRTKYKSPSLTADVVVFSIIKDPVDNYRKLASKKLSVLLIKRGEYPFKNSWALPGGFTQEGESAQETAVRELSEETAIKDIYLRQEGLFSDKSRDPRGWVISAAFSALVENDIALASKNDAKEAGWFAVDYKKIRETCKILKDGWTSSAKYELSLCSQNEKLAAVVEIETKSSIYIEHTQYKILNSKGFAFDHAKIIAFAINSLRKEGERTTAAFKFVPRYFTLTELQTVYEIILDKKLLAANFRRKIEPFVMQTSKVIKNAGHRPAKLFERNIPHFFEAEKF